MNWDVLLHWMTHVVEGSWTGFRESVASLAEPDTDLDQICRNLRVRLSDLGHADFFIEGTQRWRSLPPLLVALPMKANTAFLSGGRTPQLLEALRSAAESQNCRMTISGGDTEATATVLLSGDHSGLAQTAAALNLAYATDYSMEICGQYTPIPQLMEQSPQESAPTNWKLKSFDFQSMLWVDGLRLHAACECSSRFGVRRYYVYARRGTLLRMSKREAVYASAMLQSVKLLDYDVTTHTLSVPITAPLPELLSRAASLCAGAQGRVERGYIKYTEIPPAIGAALTVASGQPFPRTYGLAAAGR